jgi:hypothetical protein
LFHDTALLQNDDPVRMANGRQAVRDHDDGLVPDQFPQRHVHLVLVLRIGKRRRFVQYEDGRILQDRTGHGHALLFAAGEIDPAFADLCLVPARQAFDEVVALRRPGCRLNLLAGGVGPGEVRLLDEALIDRLFQNPYNNAAVGSTPYQSLGLDYRYGFGTWLESAGSPATSSVVSSSGAFGFTPWVDRTRAITGILAMEGELRTGTSFAVPLQQMLRPLIEAAVDLEQR